MNLLAKWVFRAAVLALPSMGMAQEPEKFGDWVKICEGGQPCRLVHQQTMRDSGDLALRLIAMKTDQGAVLAAQLPMGVHLPSGAVFRLRLPENAPQEQMVWQRCLNKVCEAAIQLGPDELAKFAENDAMLFAYRMDPSDEPRVMQVSLSGFNEGLAQTGE